MKKVISLIGVPGCGLIEIALYLIVERYPNAAIVSRHASWDAYGQHVSHDHFLVTGHMLRAISKALQTHDVVIVLDPEMLTAKTRSFVSKTLKNFPSAYAIGIWIERDYHTICETNKNYLPVWQAPQEVVDSLYKERISVCDMDYLNDIYYITRTTEKGISPKGIISDITHILNQI